METMLIALGGLFVVTDKHQVLMLILLHLPAAVGTADQVVVIHLLEQPGADRICLQWFCSFLLGRDLVIMMDSCSLFPRTPTCAVFPSSILLFDPVFNVAVRV